jgi:hypothetical protein
MLGAQVSIFGSFDFPETSTNYVRESLLFRSCCAKSNPNPSSLVDLVSYSRVSSSVYADALFVLTIALDSFAAAMDDPASGGGEDLVFGDISSTNMALTLPFP